MGNFLSETEKIYTFKWNPPKREDIYVMVDDLTKVPYHIYGKIVIPFSQVNQREEFIQLNHHKVILVNDVDKIKSCLSLKFRGIPIVCQEQLIKQPEICLKKHFDCQHCPIPLILEKFNQNLLRNYLNAFEIYGLNVQYYERVEIFIKADCSCPLIVCSNFELEQLSHQIQNRRYRNQKSQKLTMICFCNKDQYSLPKKIEIMMQNYNIEVILFQNMLEIIQKINKDKLQSPFAIPQKSQKIYFYVDQKEKEVNYLSKMAKKIEKTLKYLKVQKVASKHELMQEIRGNQYSVIVIGKDSKQMKKYIQIQQNLEEEGLQDRVVFLRRDSQINDKIVQKIENITINPKYVTKSIVQKYIVFYGHLQHFKNTLKNFPQLNFKRFIDTCRDDLSVNNFLAIRSEVVMTNLRICHCMEKWKDKIKCKVILLKSELSKQETNQQAETKGCLEQRWYSKQQQLLSKFQCCQGQLYGLNYNFNNKKISYISSIITEMFAKFKQKKNIFLNDYFNSIFLFSCEYYFFEQISNLVIRYFATKEFGNIDKSCQFQHLKFKLYKELIHLKKSAGIEKEVLSFLEKESCSNIFELSDKVIESAVKNQVFFQEINNIWQLFLCRDRAEYHLNCKVLLFLIFLGFNKTNFASYHNQTLQNVTLRVISSLMSCEQEAQKEFWHKNKNGYVYNFSFVLCEEVKADALKQPGQIFIRIQGSQINNFGLYLPVWRNQSFFLLAPLTKLQLSPKAQFLMLKLSLNMQQKFLQRFTQHFLVQKPSLKLFDQDRQMRKLDCFLSKMCNDRFQKAGDIQKKILQQSACKNSDLINAYIILYNLKRSQIDEAQKRLKKDKYYGILSSLISSCKGGSSVEAVHLSINNNQKEQFQVKQQKKWSIRHPSQTKSLKRNILEKNKANTNDFVLYPNYERNSNQIFSPPNASKRMSRYCPVSIKQNRGKNVQMNQTIQRNNSMKLQECLKIKILPPSNQLKMKCLSVQKERTRENQDFYQIVNTNNDFEKKCQSQLQNISQGLKKINHSKSEISKFVQFLDTQSGNEEYFLNTSKTKFIQNETQNDNIGENQKEATTSSGKFNFEKKKKIDKLIQEKVKIFPSSQFRKKSKLDNDQFKRTIEKKLFTFSKNKLAITQDQSKENVENCLKILEEENFVLSSDTHGAKIQQNSEQKSNIQRKQLFYQIDEEKYTIQQQLSSSQIEVFQQ